MSESFPTQNTTQPSKRSEEEKRLRNVIELLEKAAQQHPGHDYEKPVLAAEAQLHGAEKERMAQESNADFSTQDAIPISTQEIITPDSVQDALENVSTPAILGNTKRLEYSEYANEPIASAKYNPELEPEELYEDGSVQAHPEAFDVTLAQRKMLEAEAAYLNAYRKHLSNPKLSRLAERIANSPEYHDRQRLEHLHEEYDRTRAVFAGAVNASVKERLNKKGRGIAQLGTTKDNKVLGSTKDLYKDNPDRKKAVEERYSRMVLSKNMDIITRAEKERINTKKEALDTKGRETFTKATRWFTRGDSELRKTFGKSSARAVRVIATVTALLVGIGFPTETGRTINGAQTTTARINKSGEGAIALWGNLKQQLHTLYPDQNQAPSDVRYILNSRSYKLSEKYGFSKSPIGNLPGQSAIMHIGDTLQYDNGQIVFDGQALSSDIKPTVSFQYSPAHKVSREPLKNSAGTAEAVSTSHQQTNERTNQATKPQQQEAKPQQQQPQPQQQEEGILHDDEGNIVVDSSGNPVHTGAYVESTHHAAEKTIQAQPNLEILRHEIKTLFDPDELGRYTNTPVFDVLYKPHNISFELHKKLVNVVMRSGIGPENDETLAHFLERVSNIISHRDVSEYKFGVNGVKIPLNETRVYSSVSGQVVVYGGNTAAQNLIAYEHLLTHPKDNVLIPYKINNKISVADYSFAPATKKMPPLQLLKPILDSSGRPAPPIDISTLIKSVQ